MWIRRTHYEHLFSALSEGRATILALERANAHHTTTIEWLTTHVNRLEHERGILTSERLRVLYPVPEIRRIDPRETPMSPPAPPAAVDHELPPDAIPMLQILGAQLEDVGDAAAERLGISHDPETGAVRYSS